MSKKRNQVLTAIDKFERDLGFVAPELIGEKFDQLRSQVRDIFGEDEKGAPPRDHQGVQIGDGGTQVNTFGARR